MIRIFVVDRIGNDKQSAPAKVAFVFDAGLEGEMIIAAIDFVEEIERAESGIGREVFEIAIWAQRIGSFVLLNIIHEKALSMSITVDENNGIAFFQLGKDCASKMIMCEQTNVPNFRSHAELCND